MTREDRARIARAITEAEDGTTGQIAVRIIPDRSVDAFERAKREFGRVGLHRHAHENAALILVAPKARRYAVIGDRALHERVGETFWRETIDGSRVYFVRDDIVEGVLYAVRRLGGALHEHFAVTAVSAR